MPSNDSQARVSRYRDRLRAQGLRPVQIWVADVREPGFADKAHRQARAVADSAFAADDQGFVDSISAWPDAEE